MPQSEIVFRPGLVKSLTVGNETFRSVYDYEVAEKNLEVASEVLGETPKLREAGLRKLKEMLSGDKTMRHRTDDAYLLRFLPHRKFDVDRAYNHILNFQKLKAKYPEGFLLPPNLEHLFDQKFDKCLPYRSEEGATIFWIEISKLDYDEVTPQVILQLSTVIGDLYSMNPSLQIVGFKCIFDFEGLKVHKFIKYLTPSTLSLVLKFWQDCYPYRIKQVIFLNCNSWFRAVYSGVRHFLKKKVADRIIMLGSDMSELHEYVNPSILPKVYGGTIDEEDCVVTNFVMDNLSYIKYERSFGPTT